MVRMRPIVPLPTRSERAEPFHGANKIFFYSILILAALLYACLINRFSTGIYNDDAVYAAVSTDLTNRSISRLLPSITPDYPLPGLPIVLAPVAKLIEPHWTLLEWVSLAATVLTLWLLGKWLIEWLPAEEALFVVALYAFNPTVVKFSGILMPASYYSLAIVASFLCLSRVTRRPSVWNCSLLGLLLGWSMVLRAEGGILLISILVALYFHHQRKQVWVWVSLPIMAWVCGAIYWFKFRGLQRLDYAEDVGALFVYWSQNFWSGIRFAWLFLHLLFQRTLMAINVVPDDKHMWFSAVAIVLALIGICIGIRHLWREQSSRHGEMIGMGLFCIIYFITHSYWHVAVPRYGIALLPFMLAFLVHGMRQVFPLLRRRPAFLAILFFPFFATYAYSLGWAVNETLVSPNPMNAPPWRTLRWINRNTPVESKMMSPFAAGIALYTKRTAVTLLRLGDVEAFRFGLDKDSIDHIVDRPILFVTPGVGGTENMNKDWNKARRWLRLYPQHFPIVYRDAQEQTTIYRVAHSPGFADAFTKYYAAFHDLREGRQEAALIKVQESLVQIPDFGLAHGLLGAIYFFRHEDQKAEREFLEAATLLPDSPLPLTNLASLYHRQGDTQRAVETLNKAIAIIEANGNMHARQKKLQELVNSWERKNELIFF